MINLLFSSLSQARESEMSAYPELKIYSTYKQLARNLDTTHPETIRQFITSNADSHLAQRLQRHWLQYLAKKQRWKLLLNHYQETDDIHIKCSYLMALYHIGHKDEALNKVKPLWLVKHSQPSSCDPLFKLWLAQHPHAKQQRWLRFALAMQHHNFSLARHVAAKMQGQEKTEADLWLAVQNNPNKIYQLNATNSPNIAMIATHGLIRLAKRNPQTIGEKLEIFSKKFNLNEQQKSKIMRTIAIRHALRFNHQAKQWFKKINKDHYDELLYDWHLRHAITQQDWLEIKNAYLESPNYLKKKPGWQYWYARALEKLKEKKKAHAIFENLSKERNYYGFLASLKNGNTMHINNNKPNYIQYELDYLQKIPAIHRAKLLYRLNHKTLARREINFIVPKLNDKQRYLLTKLVANWGWYPEAIFLSQKTTLQDDMSVRFPLLHQELILAASKKHQLNPALVYAVIRQESAFRENVHSHSGAIGLMQIMPHTAKNISHWRNLSKPNNKQLEQPTLNIDYGSYYLKKMQDKAEHPVLFLAAYNAGEKSVKRWNYLQKDKQPADIWIESIPWNETRNYIKNIISFYVVYQHRLGQKPNIKAFMKEI